MPEISVVVPVYNVEKYLEKCVDSILAQTFEDFELLLVDDGSTDSSGEICDRLARTDKRIKVIHQENAGLGGARNTGIDAATGSFMLFIDSDDYIDNMTLETALKGAVDEDVDIVVFGIRTVDESGKTINECLDEVPMGQKLSPSERRDILLGFPAACNKLYKRKLFVDTGIRYPERVWYEDLRTTLKLLVLSNKVFYINDIMYNYLMRKGSITNNTNAERNIEIIEALEDLITYFKEKGLYDEYKDELEYLAVLHVYITASVRVLRIDTKHELLGEFKKYLYDTFPDYMQNKYLPRLGKNKRLVLGLLERRMYKTIALIFKIKSVL